MRARSKQSYTALLVSLCAAALMTACSSDAPTAPSNSSTPDLAAAARACHYPTQLYVSHAGGQPTDGRHFHRIGDALAAARAGRLERGELKSAACRITITVAPGLFLGSSVDAGDPSLEFYPLTVDVPDITLRGALDMELDAHGRATGNSVSHQASRLEVDDDLAPIIIALGHPGGSAGHGLTIEGFAMGGPARFAVFGIRVRRLAILGNRFQEGLHVTLDLRSTDAVIQRNHFSHSARCDMCLAGPGVYQVSGNHLQDGADMAIVTIPSLDAAFVAPVGVEPAPTPRNVEVSAEITNNEIGGYLTGHGMGVRVTGIGVGGSDSRNSSHVTFRDNFVVNNRVAVEIDAGTPVPGTRLRSDVDLTLGGNVLRQSCQTALWVDFAGAPDGPYLENSTYRLSLRGDTRFGDAWFNNPAGFGNSLVVDRRTIAHGTRQPVDEATCPD